MTHPELQAALENAAAAVYDRIETLEQCLRDRDANIATLETQVATITAERDSRPTAELYAALQADLAAAQVAPAELNAQIAALQAEITRLNAAIDAAQAGN